ncbi:MAG: histidinol dehydrogenase [Gammaproteobacteria bacterium]|nr:MAG: histidinol dehydrogenase [Gammaproteobacteria bacterium]
MSRLAITTLQTADSGFEVAFTQLLERNQGEDPDVSTIVHDIIAAVRKHGDQALLEYSQQLDQSPANTAAELEISAERLKAAFKVVDEDRRCALQAAAERVRSYHQHQQTDSWEYEEADGTLLGQRVTPLERVGLYVPGGKAAYPSSVLMSALPAKVAGVQELIMTVPMPGGEVNDMVLAAAHIAGVDRVFAVGGAQAVAAMAYGTDTVPRVDKIVGPGNIYVATAKRMVFGQVDIDMIAGPSEIAVVCDGQTQPDWVAMDLFSQAEHDELSQSMLLTPDAAFAKRVQAAMEKLLDGQPRRDIIRASLESRGAIIVTRDMDETMALVNRIAPEHLELSVEDPRAWVEQVKHAGAIFMGRYTAEALGDYCAGPSHVLPTAGTARFSSPLGVYDFQKRSSLIMCSADGADTLGRTASVLAHGEGLTAHANSAEYRIKG